MSITDQFLGKKVLIRSYASGVHFGTLEQCTPDNSGRFTVKLSNTRRIHYWEGACSCSQISNDGIRTGRVSVQLDEIIIAEAIEIIPLQEPASTNLEKQPVWKS